MNTYAPLFSEDENSCLDGVRELRVETSSEVTIPTEMLDSLIRESERLRIIIRCMNISKYGIDKDVMQAIVDMDIDEEKSDGSNTI